MGVTVLDRTRLSHAGGLAVAGIGFLVVMGLLLPDRVPGVDVWAAEALRLSPGTLAETLVAGVSDGLRAVGVVAAAAAVAWVVWQDRRRALVPAVGYIFLFSALTASSELLKGVFGRPHPTDPTDLSYPSTHVVMVIVAAIIVAAIVYPRSQRGRALIIGLAATAVVVTATTRVLLGEHYLTDVVGTAVGYSGVGLLGVMLIVPRSTGWTGAHR